MSNDEGNKAIIQWLGGDLSGPPRQRLLWQFSSLYYFGESAKQRPGRPQAPAWAAAVGRLGCAKCRPCSADGTPVGEYQSLGHQSVHRQSFFL